MSWSDSPRLALLVLTLGLGCAREAEVDLAGRDTFLRYCASCHGPPGRGDGPLAASLKTPPADLTQIAERNGGRFDERAVMATIDGAAPSRSTARVTCLCGARCSRTRSGGSPIRATKALLESRLLVDSLATIQGR